MATFVLASASPRRQQMMQELGYSVEIDPADVDETPLKNEHPKAYVIRVCEMKAKAVAERHPGKVVLAGDTTVAVGRTILGKPDDAEDSARMLRLMSGRRHHVLTGVSVVDTSGKIHTKMTKTMVKVKPLNEADIARHISSPENWEGKASGYGIQTHAAGTFIKEIKGSHTGVIGLPLVETVTLLERAGIKRS